MITIRAKFKKKDKMIYIGHLDLMRLFKRAFIRADIPIDYTQGYNPQPKLSFGTALALGVSSQGEYFDLSLTEEIDIDKFVKDLNETLPNGIEIIKATYVDDNKGIMSQIRWSSYIIEIFLENPLDDKIIQDKLKSILNKKEIIITKEKKKKKRIIKKQVDIRELIKSIELLQNNDGRLILKVMLKTGSTGNLKPEVIVDLLTKEGIAIKLDETNIERIELFIEDDGNIITPI